MTDQIERCLCGGECVIVARWRITCLYCSYMSIRRADKNVVVGLHNRMMVAARAPAEDIDALRRHAAAMTTQADLAHQALLDERQQWEEDNANFRAIVSAHDKERIRVLERSQYRSQMAEDALDTERRGWETERATLTAQSDAYWGQLQHAAEHLDELIAAHKQQIADLTDALAPVEWPPGRVPTEPGWYAYQERRPGTDGYFAVDLIHVIDGDDGLVAEYPGGGEGTINHMARWLGPVVLPRKRGGK